MNSINFEPKTCFVCGKDSVQKPLVQKYQKYRRLLYLDGKPIKHFAKIYAPEMCPHCGYAAQNISEDYSGAMGYCGLPVRMLVHDDGYQKIFHSSIDDDLKRLKLHYMILSSTWGDYGSSKALAWYYEDCGDDTQFKQYLQKYTEYLEEELASDFEWLKQKKCSAAVADFYTLSVAQNLIEAYRRLGRFGAAIQLIEHYAPSVTRPMDKDFFQKEYKLCKKQCSARTSAKRLLQTKKK